MKNIISNIFSGFSVCIKKYKILFVILLVGIVVSIILGVVSGVRINHSMFPQDFSNVPMIRYLKGSTGWSGLMFSLIFGAIILLTILVLGFWSKFCIPIGLLFFFYYVYSQTVTIISVCMEFGFFNTIILAVFMIIISLVYIFIYVWAIMLLMDNCGVAGSLKMIIKALIPVYIVFFLAILINCVFVLALKNYVIILVYK